MRHLKKLGPVIYLKLPYEELAERLGDLRQRGVVLPEGFTLRDLYEERCPLYEKHADIIIDCSGKRIREVVDEIVKHPDLQEKEGSRT
jgi:shikimate kinase